ncbi:alpha-galactosidase [Dysgonomonas macrotermitis]|uniref:Alpha-galactosidase n=1 Tax=Dysgonomonas macrotermitis TaxID=1346286 RepID=A0A1M4Y0X8_9BACT|nr:hypothetical protein [Dysgonomonas macrotermitis]SHE99338.1 hypothetical protein SAMN05444362_10340 [Dysgonomonas macrotermitis]
MKILKTAVYLLFLLGYVQTSLYAGNLPEFKSSLTSGLKQPFTIYNNWSAYDELSDNIPQTEELCMKMLDNVIRLKKQGVQIDCYMMDAFWFDVDGGYRTWNKKNWHNGPDNWLKKCKENNIIPGLWFSTNLIQSGGSPMLNFISEWEGSQTSDGAILSLFEGGYLDHLIETLQIYADKGFGVFKFDFAYFNAASDYAKSSMLPADIEEANKRVFIQAIKKFRAKNPNVIFIGYNGFGRDMENTVTPFRKTVDPRWLEIFDTLYSGDPRFSDVPMMNVWRSQDMYSDHMVQQFAFNGLPLQRIDNCSFMIGETGTCYNRGIAAWKSSLILNLARGGWLNVYHGNIDLLNNEDAQWFAKVQRTYLQLQQFGQTSIIGGIPGKGEVYGYKAVSSDGCLLTIINPSQSSQEIELPSNSYNQGHILFTDKGFTPILDGNKLVLGGEQMAVVGFGRFNMTGYDWGEESDVIIPQSIEPMNVDIQIKDNHTAQIQINNTTESLRIIFSQLDGYGKPFRSWGGAPPDGIKMDEFLKITAKQGQKNVPVKINYDKMIWSGLSWGVGEIDVKDINTKSPLTITCWSKDGDSKNFRIEVYNVTY